MSEKRFIPAPVPAEEKRFDDGKTRWWYDTKRPIPEAEREDPEQAYILVETYADKDPNDFVKIEEPMRLLFTDQAEYYAVCPPCYHAFADMQFSGSTRGGGNWRETAKRFLEQHQLLKGWCQFCDPIFGNGGWIRRSGSSWL